METLLRIRLVALLAALALTVAAAPASAHTDVGLVHGFLEVDPYMSWGSVFGPAVSGTWVFSGNIIGITSGALNLSGALGPVAGAYGASCEAFSGSNGTGSFAHHSLSDVSWPSTAGFVAPVTGNYDGGVVLAMVALQPQTTVPCSTAAGVSHFLVVGAIHILGG